MYSVLTLDCILFKLKLKCQLSNSDYNLNQCQLFCVILRLLNAQEQICCLVPTDCGHLVSPENGSISFTAGLLGNYTLNATATYINLCDLGYNLLGSAQRTCMETFEWLPGAANCSLSITI